MESSTKGDDEIYLVLEEGEGALSEEARRGGGRLFLGTQKAARDLSLLRRFGVSRIVCVGTPAFHQQQHREHGHSCHQESEYHPDNGGCDSCTEHEATRSREQLRLVYLEVPILDLPSENLIERLDECVNFVEGGMRRGEAVLVNCVYAQSRSAAVAAAYLMKQHGMSLTRAIDKVRDAQPTVHINPGFEAQLVLFADLGHKSPKALDGAPTDMPAEACANFTSVTAGATYRWFLFAARLKKEGAHNWTASTGSETHVAIGSTYRCKTCRSPLFHDSNVLNHLHPVVLAASDSIYDSFSRFGDGSSWLKARDAAAATSQRRKGDKKCGTKGRHQPRVRPGAGGGNATSIGQNRGAVPSPGSCKCTSVFTEAFDWVGVVGSEYSTDFNRISGKIQCPGKKGATSCGNKLGAWNLEGAHCSCGRMVKPAIQFTLSRIERMPTF